jgi:hypothetical protein
MKANLPTGDMRRNVGTWAVPTCNLPAIARILTDVAPPEDYDPDFAGQYLQTTYFDTLSFDLRRARLKKDRYLTLRLRCYSPASGAGGNYPEGSYALSAKTEDTKFRVPIDRSSAELALGGDVSSLLDKLPGDLLGRLLDLSGGDDLVPVVTVCAHRYAVEDDLNRLTLDVDVRADNGKVMATHVLEHKQVVRGEPQPLTVPAGLRPIKLSKYLWATRIV